MTALASTCLFLSSSTTRHTKKKKGEYHGLDNPITNEDTTNKHHSQTSLQEQQQQQNNNQKRFNRYQEERWNEQFEQLREFVARYGHTSVPKSYSVSLYRWVQRQKILYQQNQRRNNNNNSETTNDVRVTMGQQDKDNTTDDKLNDERLDRLLQLGMVCISFEDRWKIRYDQLRDFYKAHGHTRVLPSSNDTNDAEALYVWAQVQRRRYKEQSLSQDRMELLNQIEFSWQMHEDRWMAMYETLKKYKENYGDCLVPAAFFSDPELGQWVGTQREKYALREKREASKEDFSPDDPWVLSPHRIALLDEIGFVWKPRDVMWLEKYKSLQAYMEVNGHGKLLSRRFDCSLQNWINRQRILYQEVLEGKQNCLTDQRIEMLNQLSFNWKLDHRHHPNNKKKKDEKQNDKI